VPASLPIGIKIFLGIGTLLMLLGVVYFFIGTVLANESILSFDKGIAYFVTGIAFLVAALLITTIVELGDVKEQLDRLKKK